MKSSTSYTVAAGTSTAESEGPVCNSYLANQQANDSDIGEFKSGEFSAGGACTDELSPGELSSAELVSFQAKLWEIVASRIRLYTGGESSSVPELTAHRILASVCFVLGVDPDDIDPVLVRQFLRSDTNEFFMAALTELQTKVASVPELWKQVALSTPLLKSRALKDTLKSMEGFCERYNSYFFAHEITCDIDYPLAHPVPESLEGAHYVTEYLERLLLENRLMNCFDLKLCSNLLKRIHPDYKELLINLYEPIAVNAIGLALARQSIFGLNVDETARQLILEKLSGSSKRQIERAVTEAAATVLGELHMDDAHSSNYLRETALELTPRIQSGLIRGNLDGIFLGF